MRIPFCDIHIERFFYRYQRGQAPLDLALADYFRENKALGSKDRKEIGDTIYGMVRWQSLLDLACPPTSPFFRRLAFYKNEEFSLLQKNLSAPLAARLGCPEWLLKRLIQEYGKEKGIELASTLNTEASLTIRVNPLKITREELFRRWKNQFPIALCEKAPFGIRFAKRIPVFSFPEFKEGLFEVQDEGSQLLAQEVQAKPGDLVLDFCSGSGGKTLAFAHQMEGKGQIYLHDIRPSALAQAKKRLRRAGIQNVQFLEPGHIQLKKLKNKCDWVLIDLPCSGTGTFRRNPDQKWRLNEEMVSRLVLQQREIALEAISYIKTGGHLVYATCSLLRDENESQIEFLLKSTPLTLVKDSLTLPPEIGGMDGFFVTTFKKIAQ